MCNHRATCNSLFRSCARGLGIATMMTMHHGTAWGNGLFVSELTRSYTYIPLSLPPSLSASLPLSLSPSLTPSLSPCLSLSLPLPLPASLPLPPSLPLSVFCLRPLKQSHGALSTSLLPGLQCNFGYSRLTTYKKNLYQLQLPLIVVQSPTNQPPHGNSPPCYVLHQG